MGNGGESVGRSVVERVSAEYVVEPIERQYQDMVRLRLDWLVPEDRELLVLYLEKNVSVRQLSQITGVSGKVIRGRLARLGSRLVGDDYARVIRKRVLFSDEQLHVAYDHLLLGLGYRKVAERRRVSGHTARKMVRQLNDWLTADRLRDGGRDGRSIAKAS